MKHDRNCCRIPAEQTNGMAVWESQNHLDSSGWEFIYQTLLYQSLT